MAEASLLCQSVHACSADFLLASGTYVLWRLQQKYGNISEIISDRDLVNNKPLVAGHYNILIDMAAALIILVLGAGVGPAAALLSIILSLSVFQSSKLRYINAHYEELMAMPRRQRWIEFFHPIGYLLRAGEKITDKKAKLWNIVLILNGVMVFFILNRMTDQLGFITKLGSIGIGQTELLYAALLLLYGAGIGLLYKILAACLAFICRKAAWYKAALLAAGAVSIYIVYLVNPHLLSSGQHSLHYTVSYAMEATPIYLLQLAWIKALFLIVCLETGWRGGDMFPVIFVGFLQGYAVAAWQPELNYLFCIDAVTSSFLAVANKHPYLAVFFTGLFFPPVYFSVTLAVIVLIMLGKRLAAALTSAF